MTRHKRWAVLLLTVVFLVGVSVSTMGAAPQANAEKADFLIGFHGTPNPGLVRAFGGEIYREFTIVNVIAARMPSQGAEALARHPEVRYVEADGAVHAVGQTVPWGIDRVFGDEEYSFPTWTSSTGSGMAVAVLDTGIDETHEDLPQLQDGTNTIDSTHWGSDGHGHGTHVAGTIAALDNTIGVVGVGPEIGLYAVKVLNDSGSGTIASVVAGIQWAVTRSIPVLNMSLGTGTHYQTLQDACDAAYAQGHLLVAAAGNSGNPAGRGDNVGYPARYESVIAVAASDSKDKRASFSSTGPAVELIAPGVSIHSTLPGNKYGTYSGTSMASPHVAGVVALVSAANPGLTNAQIRGILQETAEDLGLPANHQGYGLVRADRAVGVDTYTVTFTVQDEDTEPLVGAVVTLGTLGSKSTDEKGEAVFAEVPAATYSYTVELEGHVTVKGSVDVVDAAKAVIVTLSPAPTEPEDPTRPTTVSVSAIDYHAPGPHLRITVALVDNLGAPVPGASVEIKVERDEEVFVESDTGQTGSDGKVTFSYRSAPSGTYTTEVVGVVAEGLTWDAVTPDNSFTKK